MKIDHLEDNELVKKDTETRRKTWKIVLAGEYFMVPQRWEALVNNTQETGDRDSWIDDERVTHLFSNSIQGRFYRHYI